MSESDERMADYRDQIDQADNMIIDGLKWRVAASTACREWKRENGVPPYDPIREAEITDRYRDLLGDLGVKVIETILYETRRNYYT